MVVRLLSAFAIRTAAECGWDELRNGKLLQEAETEGFDVLLTGDKTMPDENAIAGRRIGLVLMSDNHWRIVRDHVPAIVEALHKCHSGQAVKVFGGKFGRRSRYKPEP